MLIEQTPSCQDIEIVTTPVKWCRYLVRVGYVIVAAVTFAHLVWYLMVCSGLVQAREGYLLDRVVMPTLILLPLNLLVDFFIRSSRPPLWAKEYLVLLYFSFLALYLAATHRIATVLFGTFTLPVLASTVFANLKMTKWIFLLNNLLLLLGGVRLYLAENLGSTLLMSVFVAWNMLLCAYLLAKVLIRNTHDNLVSLIRLHHAKKDMEEQIKLDPFTGLYNRGIFDSLLPEQMRQSREAGLCLSLALIDVDKFKRVNDVYGHAMGDRVLLHLTQILRSHQSEDIKAFRIGGEEFAILFRNRCAKDAYDICEGMRTDMEASSLHQVDRNSITFSCGLACMNTQNITPEELMQTADSALYQAKNSGRNCTIIHSGSMQCKKQAH